MGLPTVIIVSLLLFLTESSPVSSIGVTGYDNLNFEHNPSFFRFDGTNALAVPLSANTSTSPDYFLRLWLRVISANGPMTVLELPGSSMKLRIVNSSVAWGSLSINLSMATSFD